MIELVGNNELERHMWLENLLKQGIYEVTFTKIDGSTRVMPCTLKAELLPPFELKENQSAKPRPLVLETLSVFATDIQEWRSFRVMNITEIKPV
jgi:hypothetical protein